jgi:signal transduction histidine kinase
VSLRDDLRRASLTNALSDEQLDDLMTLGRVHEFAPGDELFREARPADHLWILLAGEIELSQQHGSERVLYANMADPGQWTGGHAAWGSADANAVFLVTGTAVTEGRCYVVPSPELARFVDRWLPLSRHLLDAVYQTVRRVDADARQRASLIALGQLSAGLAHEINNPASAAMRAVESLRSTSNYMLQSLAALAECGVATEQFLELDAIRNEFQRRPASRLGALETADREEAIGTWMERRGVDHAWLIASTLAARGADQAWLETVEKAVDPDAVGAALQWISSATGSAGLLDELADATSRISHLVQDVKTYSQMDRAPLQRVDLSACLDSTVTMLSPKLDGIEVTRAYDDVPEIEVYAAELNQVWTNLIDNSLDAMDGDGTLRLATRLDGDDIVVEIGDTGPGIPPEVLDRVFEPFFTTKDVGSGTGLGLDISRRIVVERHGGRIDFESSPGSTTVVVRLPRQREV